MSEQTLRELLTTSVGAEGTLLIPRKILDTLISSVDRKRIDRSLAMQVVGPDGVPGSSLDVDLVDENTSQVTRVAEGAPVPIYTATYSNINIKPAKYGSRPLITKEMIEDSKFDLIESNIKEAGRKLADNESTLIIAQLDTAANSVSGGANITIANLTRGMQYLEDNDYEPTDLVVGPEVANDLRNIDTFVEADKTGGGTTPSSRLIGTIFGMAVHEVSPNAGITSTSSYVLDRNHAYMVVEKRPPTVERYDDSTHDLTGVVITQRLAVSAIRTKAIAKITTS